MNHIFGGADLAIIDFGRRYVCVFVCVSLGESDRYFGLIVTLQYANVNIRELKQNRQGQRWKCRQNYKTNYSRQKVHVNM